MAVCRFSHGLCDRAIARRILPKNVSRWHFPPFDTGRNTRPQPDRCSPPDKLSRELNTRSPPSPPSVRRGHGLFRIQKCVLHMHAWLLCRGHNEGFWPSQSQRGADFRTGPPHLPPPPLLTPLRRLSLGCVLDKSFLDRSVGFPNFGCSYCSTTVCVERASSAAAPSVTALRAASAAAAFTARPSPTTLLRRRLPPVVVRQPRVKPGR